MWPIPKDSCEPVLHPMPLREEWHMLLAAHQSADNTLICGTAASVPYPALGWKGCTAEA